MQIAEDFSYFEVHRLLWKYLPKPCCVKAAATFRENPTVECQSAEPRGWGVAESIQNPKHDPGLNGNPGLFVFVFFFYYLSASFSQIQGVLRSSPAPHVKAEMKWVMWHWSMGSDCLCVCSQSYCAKEFIQKTITKSHCTWPRPGISYCVQPCTLHTFWTRLLNQGLRERCWPVDPVKLVTYVKLSIQSRPSDGAGLSPAMTPLSLQPSSQYQR